MIEVNSQTQPAVSQDPDLETLCKPFTPLTNIHVNSLGSMIHEIGIAERIHWLDGLRCAELFIRQQQEALRVNWMEQRKFTRQADSLREQIPLLQKELDLRLNQPEVSESASMEALQYDHGTAELRRKIEAKEDRLATIQYSLNHSIPMVRDASMLVAAAITERSRIIQNHPEVLQMNFLEIQQRISPGVVLNRVAKYIAARTMKLPETAGAALLDAAPQQQAEILHLVERIHSGVDNAQSLNELATVLAKFNPQDAQTIVNKAIGAANPKLQTPIKRLLLWLADRA